MPHNGIIQWCNSNCVTEKYVKKQTENLRRSPFSPSHPLLQSPAKLRGADVANFFFFFSKILRGDCSGYILKLWIYEFFSMTLRCSSTPLMFKHSPCCYIQDGITHIKSGFWRTGQALLVHWGHVAWCFTGGLDKHVSCGSTGGLSLIRVALTRGVQDWLPISCQLRPALHHKSLPNVHNFYVTSRRISHWLLHALYCSIAKFLPNSRSMHKRYANGMNFLRLNGKL